MLQSSLRPRKKKWRSLAVKLHPAPNIAVVVPALLQWSDIGTALSLTLCCRGFHARGSPMACRFAASRRNIADSVASLIGFETQTAAALLKAGVSKSTILRTIACAWDWLEKWRHPFPDNERLFAMALLRLCVKFEFSRDHSVVAMEVLGAVCEKQALLSMECRLATMLWGQGELDTHCLDGC